MRKLTKVYSAEEWDEFVIGDIEPVIDELFIVWDKDMSIDLTTGKWNPLTITFIKNTWINRQITTVRKKYYHFQFFLTLKKLKICHYIKNTGQRLLNR